MLIYSYIKCKSHANGTHQEVVSDWDFFFPFWGLYCKALSGSDTALIGGKLSNVATRELPCHAAPLTSVNDSRTAISSLPFFVSTSLTSAIKQFNSLVCWGFFVFTFFSLSVEFAHRLSHIWLKNTVWKQVTLDLGKGLHFHGSRPNRANCRLLLKAQSHTKLCPWPWPLPLQGKTMHMYLWSLQNRCSPNFYLQKKKQNQNLNFNVSSKCLRKCSCKLCQPLSLWLWLLNSIAV